MNRLPDSATIAILALIFPIAARAANLTGTQTLNSGQGFSFDTGTVVSSGDILLGSTGLTLQGGAKALTGASFGLSGMAAYNSLVAGGPSGLSSFLPLFSSSPIPTSALTVNAIFAVQTIGGNAAAFIVTASSGLSITFQFTSFIGPAITQVLNNYGLIPAGFSNSGIAPGTLFIIKGSGLADPTAQALPLQDSRSAAGLPAALNGATVKVTVGSTSVTPAFYYAIAGQLALVLPSATPTGAGTVTVTYNGQTSAPFNTQVVQSAFGFNAYYGTGSGLVQAYSLAFGLYNYGNSVPPGTTIRLIGSGLGADSNPTRDTEYATPSASSAINALAHVYVGGVDAPIFYQGPEGFPGLDEIDVTLPANTPTGCYISLVGVSITGVATNFLTLPVGTGVCQDTGLGINGTQITTLNGQSTVKTGYVEMFYNSAAISGIQTVSTEALASFQSYNGSTYVGIGGGIVSIGGCVVGESLVSTGGTGPGTSTTTGLNAGTITVTGPNAAPVTLMAGGAVSPGLYLGNLPTGFLTTSGGSFKFQATAGTDVGAFTTSVNFPTPLLQWTNQAASAIVTRSAGQPITWTGGSSGSYVSISGSSSSASVSGVFYCLAPVAAGHFTVPAYVLATLPASSQGSLNVSNQTIPQSFTATGLDYGYAIGAVSYNINAAYN